MEFKFDKTKFDNEEEELYFNEIYLKGGGYCLEEDHHYLEEYLKQSCFSEKYKKKFMELWWEHKHEFYEEFYKKHYQEIKRSLSEPVEIKYSNKGISELNFDD